LGLKLKEKTPYKYKEWLNRPKNVQIALGLHNPSQSSKGCVDHVVLAKNVAKKTRRVIRVLSVVNIMRNSTRKRTIPKPIGNARKTGISL
jgi:hypothetical protein